MAEKVQNLAQAIYAEFEKLMGKYDEKVADGLMPLIVNALELLDASCVENEERRAEVEVLREDNEQLITQYDREKAQRKHFQQKVVEVEDSLDEEKRQLQEKSDSLEAIVRIMEVKSKSAADQVMRYEEKEKETRKEYDKLHDRYSQLFKTHVEHLERTRYLLGANNIDENGFVKEPLSSASQASEIDMDDEDVEARLAQRGRQLLNSMEQTVRAAHASPGSVAPLQSANFTNILPRRMTSYTEGDMSMEPDDMELGERDEKKDVGSDTEEEGSGDAQGAVPTERTDADAISREIEELIRENNDLLATKNALNVVKDDLIAQLDELSSEKEMFREENASLQEVKNKLKERIVNLEDNLKRMREHYELKLHEASQDDENALVPYAQQKRFTRVEMARLVQEKNKYKEQLMELQDEMRAKLSQNQRVVMQQRRGRSGFFKFFSGLFGSSGSRENSAVRYNNDHTLPPSRGGGTMSPSQQSTASRSPPASEAAPIDTADVVDLQEHYKRIATVAENAGTPQKSPPTGGRGSRGSISGRSAGKETPSGRVQAFGWSVPVVAASGAGNVLGSAVVPKPLYSRPLVEKDPDMKIWCAVGIQLPPRTVTAAAEPGSDALREQAYAAASSVIWICSSTHSSGKVTVIDANRPNDVVESFPVCSSHLLCIGYVPGAHDDVEIPVPLEKPEASPEKKAIEHPLMNSGGRGRSADLGNILFVSCATGSSPPVKSVTSAAVGHTTSNALPSDASVNNATTDLSSEMSATWDPSAESTSDHIPVDSDLGRARVEGTIWIGSQNRGLYIYHASRMYRKRLSKVVLDDAVLCIVHTTGRVLASLADGRVAVFRRVQPGGWWDTTNYHLLSLGQADHAIRAMSIVPPPYPDYIPGIRRSPGAAGSEQRDCVWAGCRNKIHVVDPLSMKILSSFEAHSRVDSAIRQMVVVGQGVWISLRLDNTLRLFHARTMQHLQDLAVEPLCALVAGKGRLGISLVRITAMSASCRRLWIGTSTGVVLSIPLSFTPDASNPDKESADVAKCLPGCDDTLAQVSYHGHREEVKFFVSIPGTYTPGGATPASNDPKASQEDASLLVSGGEGYVDFRYDDSAESGLEDSPGGNAEPRSIRSHLIVWQTPTTPTTSAPRS
ncbi:C-Jun-amino-terminal kinase-interacting protein 3-like isoform X2 [Paramacrobiotus metropolitanus]|uniref:C-Jun-amino-terminal kinase-interacting protein 3-like isoform X2 n=1 Tax=Paramacrobiotus metropolitanus TaxID=2943436 RepID=UPI002445C98C|nr:C-Jun-amino-terminal kinase-interacting protein 3-like isoform X2 [Paramacrobiotus metropolitanus]